MIDHTMPVLSEQERAHLILSCREEIEELQTLISGYSDPIFLIDRLRRQQIALAALTAKPEFYVPKTSVERIRAGSDSACCNIHSGRFKQFSVGFYTLPPVPVKQEGEQCGKCKGNGWFADEMGMRRCFMCNDLVQEGEHRD